MNERTAVQIDQVRREVAREPGRAGRRQQRAGAALRAPRPRDQAARQQRPPGGEVEDGPRWVLQAAGRPLGHQPQRDPAGPQQDSQPPQARPLTRRCPRGARPTDRASRMKPSALAAASRGPYALASRLEISTTAGAPGVPARRSATAKPSRLRQLDVEQHLISGRSRPLAAIASSPPAASPTGANPSPTQAAPEPTPGTRHTVICDTGDHASILDAVSMSRARIRPYRHNRMEKLEQMLQRAEGDGGGVLVTVDGVFSMEGDLPDLPRVAELCSGHAARLMVDEAHGVGVLGERGTGASEAFGVEDKVDLRMGTSRSRSPAAAASSPARPRSSTSCASSRGRSCSPPRPCPPPPAPHSPRCASSAPPRAVS